MFPIFEFFINDSRYTISRYYITENSERDENDSCDFD